MKKIIFMIGFSGFSQRLYEEDFFGSPMPSGDKLADSFLIGLPLLLIGGIIFYFALGSGDVNKENSKSGCFFHIIGIGVLLAGLVNFAPVLALLRNLVISVVNIGFLIAAVIFVAYIVYSIFKK